MKRWPLLSLVAILAGGCASSPVAEVVPSPERSAGPAATPELSSGGAVSTTPPSGAPPPPTGAELGRRFKEEGALGHVFVHVADPQCLKPEDSTRSLPDGIALEGFTMGERSFSMAYTKGDSLQELETMRAFVEGHPVGPTRLVYERVEAAWFENVRKEWRAYCVDKAPLFGGAAHIGRIIRADGTFDAERFKVGFSEEALRRVRALPPTVARLIVLFDDHVLLWLNLESFLQLKNPTVVLADLTL